MWLNAKPSANMAEAISSALQKREISRDARATKKNLFETYV